MQKKRAWKAFLAYTCAWAWTIRHGLNEIDFEVDLIVPLMSFEVPTELKARYATFKTMKFVILTLQGLRGKRTDNRRTSSLSVLTKCVDSVRTIVATNKRQPHYEVQPYFKQERRLRFIAFGISFCSGLLCEGPRERISRDLQSSTRCQWPSISFQMSQIWKDCKGYVHY